MDQSLEEIKEMLFKNHVRVDKVYFILGYLSDKPERWRKIFMLRSKGMSQSDIGEAVGVEQNTVSSALAKISKSIDILKS